MILYDVTCFNFIFSREILSLAVMINALTLSIKMPDVSYNINSGSVPLVVKIIILVKAVIAIIMGRVTGILWS